MKRILLWTALGLALPVLLAAAPARAGAGLNPASDLAGGPYEVITATVHVRAAPGIPGGDYPTIVRYDPVTGRTWVMSPAVEVGSAPYWVPVTEPLSHRAHGR